MNYNNESYLVSIVGGEALALFQYKEDAQDFCDFKNKSSQTDLYEVCTIFTEDTQEYL